MAENLPTPRMVGFFGRDADHGFQEGIATLRYVTVDIETALPIDINIDPSNVLPYQEDFENFPFHRYLLKKVDLIKGYLGNSLAEATIVTARLEMRRLREVNYRHKKMNPKHPPRPKYFVAILFKGAIYFFIHKTYDTPYNRGKARLVHRYYQAMLAETPDGSPDMTEMLKEAENFHGVFDINLKRHRILYNSVIDGVMANTPETKSPICQDDDNTILEDLKKREIVKLKLWDRNYKAKSYLNSNATWLYTFLSGASKILFGFHKDGIVDEIKEFTLETFESFNEGLHAEGVKYFNCLDEVFDKIKDCFAKEIDEKHPGIEFKDLPIISLKFKGENFEIKLIDDTDHMKLPQWYVEELNKLL